MAHEDYAPVLTTKVGELSGLASARDYRNLPNRIGEVPIAIILPVRGQSQEYSVSGGDFEEDRIAITIYTASSLLAEGFSAAVPFIKLVRNKLAANVTLDNTVEHILPESPWYEGPGQMRYGGQEQLVGIRFLYRVKENTAGVFTVAA